MGYNWVHNPMDNLVDSIQLSVNCPLVNRTSDRKATNSGIVLTGNISELRCDVSINVRNGNINRNSILLLSKKDTEISKKIPIKLEDFLTIKSTELLHRCNVYGV